MSCSGRRHDNGRSGRLRSRRRRRSRASRRGRRRVVSLRKGALRQLDRVHRSQEDGRRIGHDVRALLENFLVRVNAGEVWEVSATFVCVCLPVDNDDRVGVDCTRVRVGGHGEIYERPSEADRLPVAIGSGDVAMCSEHRVAKLHVSASGTRRSANEVSARMSNV